MKEAQPIADAGSLNLEASPAPRRNAADGGEMARALHQEAEAPLADAGRTSVSPEASAQLAQDAQDAQDAHDAQLAPEDADRFAMAFRPSWEPVAPLPADAASNVRFRSFLPSLAPMAPPAVNDASGMLQDDLLHLRAARVRKRSLALAAVSILSFGALMYWGIYSTTDGAERNALRALQPPPQAAEEAAADKAEDVAPAAPSVAEPEPTKFSARLADPSALAVAPQGQAAPAPANAGETQAAEAQPVAQGDPSAPAPHAAATATSAVAPANPESKPVTAALSSATATVSATPLKPTAAPVEPKPAATITDVKPATAAAEVAPAKPAPAASSVSPGAESKPLVAAAVAATAKPAAPSGESEASPQRSAAAPTDAPQDARKTPEPAEARPPLLVVRAVPDGAQLFLDGQRMSNPFDTRLPLGSKHKIDARQDGYETSSQSIRLESDAKLTITLKHTTPTPEPHLKVRPLPESANGAGFVTSNPY